jgi:hypothetical protein
MGQLSNGAVYGIFATSRDTLPGVNGQWHKPLYAVPNGRRGTVHSWFRRAVRSFDTSQACIADVMIQS